jgi:hypothetical protein
MDESGQGDRTLGILDEEDGFRTVGIGFDDGFPSGGDMDDVDAFFFAMHTSLVTPE